MNKYRKAVASVIGAFCIWALASWADGSEITRMEWLALVAAVGTPLGVYQVPNEPS